MIPPGGCGSGPWPRGGIFVNKIVCVLCCTLAVPESSFGFIYLRIYYLHLAHHARGARPGGPLSRATLGSDGPAPRKSAKKGSALFRSASLPRGPLHIGPRSSLPSQLVLPLSTCFHSIVPPHRFALSPPPLFYRANKQSLCLVPGGRLWFLHLLLPAAPLSCFAPRSAPVEIPAPGRRHRRTR
jgi:hypothetical protein